MNTDTEDMLSPDLDWRKLDKELSAEFPQFSGNILVVIEASTPDQAMDAADRLYEQLKQETILLKSVFSFRSLPFFKKSSLLFLEEDELQDVSDRLAEIQPFLSRLTEDQNIRGLFTMLEEAIRAKLDGESVELSPLIKQINENELITVEFPRWDDQETNWEDPQSIWEALIAIKKFKREQLN